MISIDYDLTNESNNDAIITYTDAIIAGNIMLILFFAILSKDLFTFTYLQHACITQSVLLSLFFVQAVCIKNSQEKNLFRLYRYQNEIVQFQNFND
jgi:hypothetical protein